MSKHSEHMIKIWPHGQVPQCLKRLLGNKSEWVVLIPPSLASLELEALFLCSRSDTRSVIRRTLADGSILFWSGDSDTGE
jgi:hypothetical protein